MNRILLAFLLAAGLLLAGCKNNAAKQQGNEYHYYPSKNIYYNVHSHHYIYSLDSGKTWDSLTSKQDDAAIEGEKQVIYSTSPEIWLDNNTHLAKYKGKLLNIINEESLRSPEPKPKVKTEPKTELPLANTTAEEKKERKRPVKKFFQKLFGKKKD